MSDGPHRSLPMKPCWRNVAERADKNVHGIDEISSAIIPALARDCRDEMSPQFIDRIRGIFETQQSLLFKEDLKSHVESLRQEAGSGIGRRLIENVVRISPDKEPGFILLVEAMTNTLIERTARCSRQVEEHYIRESTVSRTNNVRSRLEQGVHSAPIEALARQILKLESSYKSRLPAKQDGLDEGPNIR